MACGGVAFIAVLEWLRRAEGCAGLVRYVACGPGSRRQELALQFIAWCGECERGLSGAKLHGPGLGHVAYRGGVAAPGLETAWRNIRRSRRRSGSNHRR